MTPAERFKTSGGENGYGAFLPSDLAVDAFLAEIVAVCKKHRISISHQDDHGAFLIQEFRQVEHPVVVP